MCRKSVEDKTIEINAQLDRDRIKICPKKIPPFLSILLRKKKHENSRPQLGEKFYETCFELYNYILFKVTKYYQNNQIHIELIYNISRHAHM